MQISTWLLIQCILMFIAGQALYLFWIKIPSVKELCRVANKTFSWKEYWASDWNLILGTMVLGIMLIIGLNEIIHWKPQILDYIKWFFGGIGAFATTVVLAKFSQFGKKVNNVIDIKTDIADGVEKP